MTREQVTIIAIFTLLLVIAVYGIAKRFACNRKQSTPDRNPPTNSPTH